MRNAAWAWGPQCHIGASFWCSYSTAPRSPLKRRAYRTCRRMRFWQFIFGSSEEFVGRFRLRQLAK